MTPPPPEATPTPTHRATRQRTAVLAALDNSDGFRSAQEWHEVLRARSIDVGLATVYRALQSLAEAGAVDAVRSEAGETLYRRCGDSDGHHHHLRCRACGAGVEIEGPGVEAWAQTVAAAHGYSRIEHTVELTGLCGACAAKEG